MSMKKNTMLITLAACAFMYIPTHASYAKEAKSATVANAVSDSAITAAIKAKYLVDDEIKGMNIHVKTVNGKVILTGKVDNASVEEHAILVALNTEGAKEVISRLKLNK